MNESINITLCLAGSFLTLFIIAELIYRYARVQAEWTRKLVHIGTGFLTLLFPILLNNRWLVLALCFSFAILLMGSLKLKFLASINAIGRSSHGSITYPLSVFLCYCFYEWYRSKSFCRETGHIAFYMPMLILAVSDPMAAMFGRRWPLGKYKSGKEYKSLLGSFVFFVSSFGISYLLLSVTNSNFTSQGILFISSVGIGIITGLAEALSRNGMDNLFIPCTAMISILLFSPFWV